MKNNLSDLKQFPLKVLEDYMIDKLEIYMYVWFSKYYIMTKQNPEV